MAKQIKRRKSGQFAKGGKPGPGRPRKGKEKPDGKPVTTQQITQKFFDFFDKHFTEAKMKELLTSKKFQMEFLQEVRRLLPTLQAISADVKQDFSPLKIEVVNVEGSEIESGKIKELEAKITKQQRFIDAYEKALKEHGLVPTIKHEPIEPLVHTEGQDETFKSDAEKKLQEEDEDDCNPDNLPSADVVYSGR